MSIPQRRMYIFLMVTAIASQLGMQGWVTLLNNFSVEAANINPFELGLVQSMREVPGFLSLLVIYLLFLFTEHRGRCPLHPGAGAGGVPGRLFPVLHRAHIHHPDHVHGFPLLRAPEPVAVAAVLQPGDGPGDPGQAALVHVLRQHHRGRGHLADGRAPVLRAHVPGGWLRRDLDGPVGPSSRTPRTSPCPSSARR